MPEEKRIGGPVYATLDSEHAQGIYLGTPENKNDF